MVIHIFFNYSSEALYVQNISKLRTCNTIVVIKITIKFNFMLKSCYRERLDKLCLMSCNNKLKYL